LGAFGEGGGLCSFRGDIIITGSTISYNTASGVGGQESLGGGIYLLDGTITVQSASKILRNFSSDDGGGIYYGGPGTGSISADSIVAKNIPNDTVP